MKHPRFLRQIIIATWVAVFSAACVMPWPVRPTEPNLPPPPPATPQMHPQPDTPLPPPPSPGPPVQTPGQSTLFKFIRTVEVAPDTQFTGAAFGRVNYVPANNGFVVTFAARFSEPLGGCEILGGHAYKEYTLDMEPTGESGVLNCEVADRGSVMVGNTYYDVSMHAEGDSVGWRIMKYDAATWEMLVDIFFPLETPVEGDGDPMVTYVNGMLDVSSGYNEAGGPPPPDQGAGTHHEFFSDDLSFLYQRILADTPHIGGSSMIYVDGVYYFITSTSYTGDIIVMEYDNDWRYLGKKDLISQGHFSTGVAYDGNRFYVAYTDTSKETEDAWYLDIHLAAFDREWNLVEDLAVTEYPLSEKYRPMRPWVILHDNRLYVSYDQEGATGESVAGFVPGSVFVSVYELVQSAP